MRLFSILAPILAGSLCAAPSALGSYSLKDLRVAAPVSVEVWNRPVVEIRAEFGDLNIGARAEGIAAKIENLPPSAWSEPVAAQSARVGELEGIMVTVGTRSVFGLVREDLDPESNKTLEQVGADTTQRLRAILDARIEQQKLPRLLRGIAGTVGATLLFAALLWVIHSAKRRAEQRLARVARTSRLQIFGVKVRPFMRTLERRAVSVTAYGSGLLGAYVWLAYSLKQFPYTEPWGQGLGKYFFSVFADLGRGAIEAIPGLFTVLIVFLITRLVVGSVKSFFSAVKSGRLHPGWVESGTAEATQRLMVVLIWIFALVVAYPYIPGSDSDAFKGISVFVGLMVSLGSAGFINQIMNGLVIVYTRAFGVGDFVRISDQEGIVTQVGMLSTKLVTPKREEITIPNALVTGRDIYNYSRSSVDRGVAVSTAVTIGYDTPWRQVHALLKLASERTRGIRKQPKPAVLQRALSDFYVEYELIVYLEKIEEKRRVLSDLHAEILDVFNEFGVQIMSPHFEAQPEQAIVVPKAGWRPAPADAERREG